MVLTTRCFGQSPTLAVASLAINHGCLWFKEDLLSSLSWSITTKRSTKGISDTDHRRVEYEGTSVEFSRSLSTACQLIRGHPRSTTPATYTSDTLAQSACLDQCYLGPLSFVLP